MNEEKLTEAQFLDLAGKAQKEGRLIIALFEDEDGNWRGAFKRGDKELYARQSGPETVLQLLLTHDGKPHTKTE